MDECMDLPPGFRFHPTDEEIITHYLCPKVVNPSFSARAMGEADLNKCEPWDLPSKAKMGEKEWYFFCQRDRKYPTGMRTNRATESGYWKATGKDREIFRGRGILVGMKKTLVFYRGRAPKGAKSNWVMHEYRMEGKYPFNSLPNAAKDEWVVCRVFHKSSGAKKNPMPIPRMNSSFGDLLDSPSLPPLMDSATSFNSKPGSSSSYLYGNKSENDDSFDFKGLLTGTTAPMSSPYFPPGLDEFSATFSNMNQIPGSNSLYNDNQMGQIPTPNSHFLQSGSVDMGCLHQDQRQCKVEQFPNHSMVSDDTGLSTDRNTEISSVVSSYDGLDVPATGPPLDLDNMWKC